MFDSVTSTSPFPQLPDHAETSSFHRHLEGKGQNMPYTGPKRPRPHPPNVLDKPFLQFNPNESFPLPNYPVSYERTRFEGDYDPALIKGKPSQRLHSRQMENTRRLEQEKAYQAAQPDLIARLPTHSVLGGRLNLAAYRISGISLEELNDGVLSIARDSIQRGTTRVDLPYFIVTMSKLSADKIRDGGKDGLLKKVLQDIALHEAKSRTYKHLESYTPASP